MQVYCCIVAQRFGKDEMDRTTEEREIDAACAPRETGGAYTADPKDDSSIFPFLLRLANGEDIPKGAGVPLDGIVRLSAQHRTRPLLSRYAGDDPSVKDMLYRWSILNARKHALLRRIVKALASDEIEYVIIKGASLCALWGEEDRRDYDDIDILVRPDSFGRVAELLNELGLSTGYELTHPTIRNLSKVGRHLDFSGDSGESVEVSSRGLVPYFAEIPLGSIFSESVNVEIDGMDICVAGGVEGMIYLSAHGCAHHWTRLRWVLDIVSMLDHLTVEECRRCVELSMRWGLLRCLMTGVALVRELGLSVDEEKLHVICGIPSGGRHAVRLAREAAENLREHTMKFSVSTRKMLRYQLLCRERLRDRAMMLLRLICQPSLNDIIYTSRYRRASRSLFLVRIAGVIRRRLLFFLGRS